jgi:hypothetical protein
MEMRFHLGEIAGFQQGEGREKGTPSPPKKMRKGLPKITHFCETVQNSFQIRAFPGLRSETLTG